MIEERLNSLLELAINNNIFRFYIYANNDIMMEKYLELKKVVKSPYDEDVAELLLERAGITREYMQIGYFQKELKDRTIIIRVSVQLDNVICVILEDEEGNWL